MKKRLLPLVLAMLLLTLLACSCDDNTPPTEEASSLPIQEESSEAPKPDIYTVVYSEAYEEQANAIVAAVKTACGADFPLSIYNSSNLPENAIMLGIADSVADGITADMAKRDYAVKTVGSHIYLCAGSRQTLPECAAYFIDNCIAATGIDLGKTDYLYDHVYPLETVTVNGRPLSEFRIVYTDTVNEAKYKNVAAKVKTHISEQGNASLLSLSDITAEKECELLIGTTGRGITSADCEKDFEYNEYCVTVSGTKISVVGGSACAVWQGLKTLEFKAIENKGVLTDYTAIGTSVLVKVACVGDSITKGANSDDPTSQTYPVYLQEMLGYDYYVKNYGIDGYSLIDTDYYNYAHTAEYTASKALVPDVVLFMLGTNDCNPGQDYKDWTKPARAVNYKASANRFFGSYRALNPNVQIFMAIPPSLFPSTVWTLWEEWAARITANTMPLNREIAAENELPVIDMYTWSLENPEVFTDGLHPRNETYKRYARRVYDEIIDTLLKPEDLIG